MLKTTSVIIFGTFENFGDFGIYSNFFSKRPLSPFFNCAECEAVSIGTLFHHEATLKLGEGGKFRKYSKVPIYFFQGCRLKLRHNFRDQISLIKTFYGNTIFNEKK